VSRAVRLTGLTGRAGRAGRQAGMTLIEVMIASAIMVVMMTLAWKTISNTSATSKRFTRYEERNHELRMALGRMVADFEGAYLSRNEDITATHPRTMLVAKGGGNVPQIRFSTLGHRVLWADANESEQTAITYLAHPAEDGTVDLVRREQRRLSNNVPEDEPADYDILVHDLVKLRLEYWDWKNLAWIETWDTTQADAQRGRLPTRVRITLTVKGPGDADYTLTSQARLLLQESLSFVQ
jgi:prepilin-type N-terminal cleavage/methylation domain-containing protein